MFIPQKKIPAFAGHAFSKGMILLLLFLTAGGISHSFAQSGKERQLADQYLSNSEFAKAAEL
jgi:hypothetical protein